MMARAGFDWLAVDMEHAGISGGELLNLIRVVELAGTAPLVRVGANDPFLIKRALDAGAHGVIVPNVGTPEEAEAAVKASRYPPRGERGVGLHRAQDYGLGFPDYKNWADEHTLVAIQIEHKDAVPRLKEMLEVDGVDAFFIGPYDLSGSHGRPGEFDHPDVKPSLDGIKAVVAQGVEPASGLHVVAPDPAKLKEAIEDGYRFVAFASDLLILAHALEDHGKALGLQETIRRVRGSAPQRRV
jgi:2-dehydro-3-deoxyglucarate aldolase